MDDRETALGPQRTEGVRALLVALRERLARAEERADDDAFVSAAVELLTHLQSERGGVAGAVDLDVAAMLGTIERLQLVHLDELALELAFAARSIADQARDRGGRRRSDLVARTELLAAASCLALCEHEPAAHCLSRALGIPKDMLADPSPNTDGRLLEAASTLAALDARESVDLALTALVTVARWGAAVGRFALADAALVRVLAAGDEAPFRRAEIALLRAETAVEAAARLPAGAHEPGDPRWTVLEATDLAFRGRLSEADRRWQEVGGEACADPLLAREALRARAQMLCRLNRVGEALELLERLPDDPDSRHLAELVHARSGGALPDASPTALEAMRDPTGPSPYRSPASVSGVAVAEDASSRSHERLSREIARRTQLAQLALHRGERAAAEAILAPARRWISTCDAELPRARMAFTEALLRYYTDRLDAAQSLASAARAAFLALDMPLEASAAVQVLRWVALREGRKDVATELRREHDGLLDRVGSLLSSDDRNLWLTNKWAEADELVNDVFRVLRCAYPRGPSRRERRRRSQVLGTALHAMDAARTWALPDEAPRGADGIDGDGADALVRAQLVLRRHARHIHEAERLHVWWLARDTAVVRYVVLPDRIETVLLSPSEAWLLDPPTGSTRVALRQALGDSLNWLMRKAERWDPDRRALVRLSRLLSIEPLAERLPSSVTRLVIVPDDVVFQVPFGALPLDGAPLAKRFAIEIAPTARYRARPRAAIGPRTKIVGVAVSDARDPSLKPLDAERELDAIRRHHGGRLMDLAGVAASRASVSAAVVGAGVAHFACHGRLDLSNLGESGLALHDGWSGLDAVARMDLRGTDLVVAAACWSGSSTVLAGREVVSLPCVLLRAGARAAIASVFEVNDATSPDFIGALYGRLGKNDPAVALAETQVDWLHMPPRDWAGNVVFTSGAPPAALAVPLIALTRAWRRIAGTRSVSRPQLAEHAS